MTTVRDHAELMVDCLREVEVEASIPPGSGWVRLRHACDVDPMTAWRAFNIAAVSIGSPTLDVDQWVTYQLDRAASPEHRAALAAWLDGWGIPVL